MILGEEGQRKASVYACVYVLAETSLQLPIDVAQVKDKPEET